MKKSYRVKKEKDFKALFDAGHSVANRKFVVYSLDRDLPHFRVGLSVSKRLGNAVTRNRVKRRLLTCTDGHVISVRTSRFCRYCS